MKNIFIGLLGTVITLTLSTPGLAQERRNYVSPARDSGCESVRQNLCYDRMDNGERAIYIFVEVAGTVYGVGIRESDNYNIALLRNITTGESIAAATVNDDGSPVRLPNGNPILAIGDLDFFLAFQQEYRLLFANKNW